MFDPEIPADRPKNKRGRPNKPPNLLQESTIKKKFYKEVERILQTVDQLNEQCKIKQWPYKMEISASTLQLARGKIWPQETAEKPRIFITTFDLLRVKIIWKLKK